MKDTIHLGLLLLALLLNSVAPWLKSGANWRVGYLFDGVSYALFSIVIIVGAYRLFYDGDLSTAPMWMKIVFGAMTCAVLGLLIGKAAGFMQCATAAKGRDDA